MTVGPLVKLCLAAIVYFLMMANAAAVEHKRVMILHSVGREFRPWSEYAKDVRAELDRQSPWPLDVQEHSLVAARSADQNPEAPFVEYLRTLYGDHPPDLIIVIGAPAASFIQRHRKDLFSTVPALFTTVDQRRVQTSDLTENDTVVAVIHDFRFLFESFLRVAPDTKAIAIINGDSPNERFWKGEMRRELQPLEGRIEVKWYDKLSYEDLLKQTAALPPHSAIFWNTMIVDGAGVAHEGDRALTQLYQTANAPIFSHNDAFYGGEIVGGPMHSALAGSKKAVAVAIRILGGEKPGDIKTPSINYAAPKYDWRQLQRWHISERLLPPGAEVDFRVPSPWETYHWQILFICAVVLAQATLIALLLHERRRRTSAEVQSRQRMLGMELASDAGNLGMWTWNIVQDTVWATGRGRALFGFSESEVLSLEKITNALHPDDRELRRHAVETALATDTEYELQYRVPLADGQIRWLSSRGRVEHDGSGKPVLMRGVVLDISARRRAEIELQHLHDQLAHASRVSMMGQLASAIAHEVTQPLAAILANTEAAKLFLDREPLDLEELRAALDDIYRDDMRAGNVIERLGTMLKRRDFVASALSVSELLETVVILTRIGCAARKVTLEVLTPGLPAVLGDLVQLQQVLINLILNATDAVAALPADRRIVTVQAARHENGVVEFAVSDLGPGIDSAALSRLFEPFFTTKPSGMGIGLSISRTIIEAHGGRIWAENNAGDGATFRFTLPLAAKETSA